MCAFYDLFTSAPQSAVSIDVYACDSMQLSFECIEK